MNKRREVSNVFFFGGSVILTALLLSLAFPTTAKIEARKTEKPSRTVPEHKLKKSDFGKMPLLFEENKGQTDRTAKFTSRGAGYTLYLAETEAVFQLRTAGPGRRNDVENPESAIPDPKPDSDTLRMKFVGANRKPAISGEAAAVTRTNYYAGKKRFENIANYERVNYKNLYDGIDAVFYADADNQLEYDFAVAPNADADKIALKFDGAENVSIDARGDLVIETANAELVQPKPFTYQEIDGERREVVSRYILTDEKTIKFEVGEYDRRRPLVIDPKISYLTFLGGSFADNATSVQVDAAGNAYLGGTTASTDFPVPNSRSSNKSTAVFVAKLDPTGQTLLYLTFLDGEEADGNGGLYFGNEGPSLAVDSSGRAYVAGFTDSKSFPTTDGAYQTRKSICIVLDCDYRSSLADAFVAKLNADGTVSYATYLGGRYGDAANGIAVDSVGRAYVTGVTFSGVTFPTPHGFQGTGVHGASADAFLTVFNADGSDIVYSTGFGGSNFESAFGVALDGGNNVYITGETDSENTFPTRNAFQAASGGGTDAFVAKFNTSLSGDASLIYSTFVGGAGGDEANAVAVFNGKAHITGVTGSFDYPLLNPLDSVNQINEAFVTVLNGNGTLAHSTFLGGNGIDEGTAVDVDKTGNIYVAGLTKSADFPTALPFQAVKQTNFDGFVTKLRFESGAGASRGILSSTYLGGNGDDEPRGIAVLNARVVYVAGFSGSTDLPTTPGALDDVGGGDGFAARILDTHLDSVGAFRPGSFFQITQSTADIVLQNLDFGQSGQRGVAGDWNGDGVRTVGHFTNGVWKYRNNNFAPAGASHFTVNFGQAGDLPVAGDWDGDGTETPGVYRPSVNKFFLTNSTGGLPPVEITVNFGLAEDLPVAGDWNGDGVDSVGVFRPSTGQFFLTDDSAAKASIDQTFFFGIAGDQPTAGDWDGDGVDTVGVLRPSTPEFFLTNDNILVSHNFLFGQINTDQPIAGDWDGKPLP